MVIPDLIRKNCSLFDGLDDLTIAEILKRSEEKVFPSRSRLIEKGDVPDYLYILLNGKVGIYNEDILLAELGEFSIMGESFLANASATATIIALTELSVLRIHRDNCVMLAAKYPQLMTNIFSINFMRLRNSNDAALREARAREERLEQLVTQRTKELNETLEELRTTNHELSVTRDNLIETQKFRQQFLANMSHEIRTPMNAILGLTNLLVKSPLNELQSKYLNVIRKSGSNLLVIINDILDLAKIESGKMELESVPFPLRATVNNIQTILSLKAEEKGIQMLEVLADDVPEYVLGDETRITQVIMNLAGNAIKFTEKGNVTLSVSVVGRDGDKTQVKFSVKDTGIGIPADKLDTIFESFGQASSDTTRKFGGTGLGLTISRQLVELHGGHLHVSSKYGEGSEFYFVITYTNAEKPVESVKDRHEESRSLKGHKILLVEDNAFNQMVAVDTLMDLFPELEVEVAETGEDAVKKLEAPAEKEFSMVLMDIHLPGMDGFDTTRYIRNKMSQGNKKVPICAMTASVTKDRIDECFTSGMNDYLMKPFDPEDLKDRILRNIFGTAP